MLGKINHSENNVKYSVGKGEDCEGWECLIV